MGTYEYYWDSHKHLNSRIRQKHERLEVAESRNRLLDQYRKQREDYILLRL